MEAYELDVLLGGDPRRGGRRRRAAGVPG
jgi:hypothetical protein